MKTKQKLPQSFNTETVGRSSPWPGTANDNTHSSTATPRKNYDLAAKMTVMPHSPGNNNDHREKCSPSLPTSDRPPQPTSKGAELKPRGFACLDSDIHYKMNPKWLWKLPQWRRFNRALRVASPRPVKRRPPASKKQIIQQGTEDVVVSTCPFARVVRNLQLRTSSSESSPSPLVTPKHRQATNAYRTRRYLKQLKWYQALQDEKKRTQKLDQQFSKMTRSPADSSVVKGTTKCPGLESLGLTYQRQKRKRGSPSERSLPATKKLSRKTSRKLWRRQLDSSSTDSPVSESSTGATPFHLRSMSFRSPDTLMCAASDTFASPQATSSTKKESALANIPTVSQQCVNDSSDSSLRELKESGVARCPVSRLKIVDVSTSSGTFSPTHDTKSPKTVRFKDFPNPGDSPPASASRISDDAKSFVFSPSHLRLPSTPHVSKCKTKSARPPKNPALVKYKAQLNTSSDLEVNEKHQPRKSDLALTSPHPLQSTSEMIPSLRPTWRGAQRVKDPHQIKKNIKDVCQITSNNPSQTATRLQAHPQAQFKTPSLKRSEKASASKATVSTIKWPCSASQGSLKTVNLTPGYNCAGWMQTPFRKPDTPRPKSCPEFLKWKKVLKQRTESTRQASRSVSICQGHSVQKKAGLHSQVFGNLSEPSPEQSLKLSDRSVSNSKFTQECGVKTPEIQYSGGDTLTHSGLLSSNSVPAAAPKAAVEQLQLKIPCPSPTLQIIQEQSSSSSNPEITQATFGSMKPFRGVQQGEAEDTSTDTTWHPGPSPDSSAFSVNASQMSARTSLSGDKCYIFKQMELTQLSHSQDTSRLVQVVPVPCRLPQGGGGIHTQPLSEPEKSGRASESHRELHTQ
ncbi:uncharacterized protein [Hoplias malabaricus]|uniref:uncharacterized protein isoform X2 n=1 Tax=Hoplias malabaricus TaxID=27720 RepID=UPI00346266E4